MRAHPAMRRVQVRPPRPLMRILISNPDTIGDLVLRQPVFRALQEAGHELMLVVRPLLEPVAPLVAPGARVVVAPEHLYRGALESADACFVPVVEAAKAFNPDVLAVAPFQWTVLEERLWSTFSDARRVAMTGRLFTDPTFGPSAPSAIQPSVQVAEDTPESHKNARLASAILGRAIELPDPRLEASDAQRKAAEAELARLALAPGEYWAACVGHTSYTAVRNWRPERWAGLLSRWARTHGRRFLLIGTQSEGASAGRIRELMGDAAAHAVPWFGVGHGALDVLIGLLALSRGYVGRDTGPMHIAAALGKPVLAVFGGGTWPRFLPSVDPSVAITIGVPCAGCGWVCHLAESYCVKEVQLEDVASAADALERGQVEKRSVRLIAADGVLTARIGREGASSARERLVQLSLARRATKEAEVNAESGGAIDGLLGEAPYTVASAAEPKAWAPPPASGGEAGLRVELEHARWLLGQARGRIGQLEANAAETVNFRAQQAAQITSTREYLVEVKARAAALEKRLEERTGELMAAKAELAEARTQVRLEGAATQQLAILKAELDKCRAEIAVRVRESVDYQERVKGLTAQVGEAMQFGTAEHRKRESLLIEKLNESRQKLTAAEGRLTDLRQHVTRLQGEKAALAELTRVQDGEIHTLRARVRDLAISRWRRIGQRLHLAMELPWESEYRNGTPGAKHPAPPVKAH